MIIERNLEIEYKYWAGIPQDEFHMKIENYLGYRVIPIHVISCDDYYIRKGSSEFVRYRKGGGKTELTLKFKRDANTVRKEINLNVDGNDDLSIVEFLKLSGYEKGFAVFKEAWIYKLEGCELSYYTLSDGRSVIEIEAVNQTDKDVALDMLDDWVKILKLPDQSRERRSLFEIFTEEA